MTDRWPPIRTRSKRSLRTACRKAKLPMTVDSVADLGNLFLCLMVQGIDHVYVGRRAFYEAVLDAAPIKEEWPPCPKS